MRNKNHKNQLIKQIAKYRMEYLFAKAHEIFPEKKVLANRYVYLARRYSQRARLKLPSDWKKRICNHCKMFLYPGINWRTRMQTRNGRGSHVSSTCLECNTTTRYFIKIKK